MRLYGAFYLLLNKMPKVYVKSASDLQKKHWTSFLNDCFALFIVFR